MSERRGERVYYAQERKRAHRCCHEEGGNVGNLNADGQRSRATDYRLQHCEYAEHEETPQVTLPGFRPLDAFGIDLEQEDYHEHEGADPKRQVHEQRRHSRAVRIGVVEPRGRKLGWRAHEIGDVLGIQRAVFQKVGDDVGLRH